VVLFPSRVPVIDDARDVLAAGAVRAVMAVLAVRGHALEPARHPTALIDAARDRLAIETQRESDADGAERVVSVRASDQRRIDLDRADGRPRDEVQPVQSEVPRLGRDV